MTPAQTEPFVPLIAATANRRGESADYRVNVVSQPTQTQSFKPLPTEISSPAKAPVPHTNPNCEPRVSIQRDGDVVTGIRIQCSCGQVIELACVY